MRRLRRVAVGVLAGFIKMGTEIRNGKRERSSLAKLSSLLAGISTEREMEAFLTVLLTPSELQNIPQRFRVLELLLRKVPQRKIAEEICGSLCKVTRGSRMLREHREMAVRLERFFQEEKD